MENHPASPPVSAPDDWWWVFDPRRSLRAMATLLFGLGAAAFTTLLVWLAGRSLEQTFVQHLGGSFETLAVQMSDKLERTIYERSHALQFVASLAPLRTADTSVPDRRRLLSAVQDGSPDLAWIGFADRSGKIVASTNRLDEGASADMLPWFRGAREQPYVGNPHDARETVADPLAAEGTDTDPRVFDLAVPVADLDGRFLGILAAQVRWGWTRDMQRSIVPDAARRERIGLTVYAGNGDILIDSGGSGWTRPPGPPAIPGTRTFRGNLTEPTEGGTTYLTGFVRSRGYRDHRGNGWITAVRQPVDYALSPVTDVKRTIARWGIAFTVAGMAGAWYFASRLSRRLRSVGTAAARIESGDVLAALPSARGEGELEHMCRALGRMVDHFRAHGKTPPSPAKPTDPW